MSVYCILDVDIKDPERYREYMIRAQPLIEAAGGRYLCRGGEHKVYEGEWQPTRLVLVEFPTAADAESFYNSEDYREAKQIRQSCAETCMVVVKGVD